MEAFQDSTLSKSLNSINVPTTMILFLKIANVYFERERASQCESRSKVGAERGRENIPSWLPAASTEPSAGLEPTNHEIMT